MSSRQKVPFLKRCGLTFENLAAAAHSVPHAPPNAPSFSIQMLNDVKFSRSDCPSVPTAKGRLELLRVELHDDLLTIANVNGERRREDDAIVEWVGARLYAQRTITMRGATVFMFLPEPPAGMSDAKFFPANGSVVLYDDEQCGPRVLKACGVDRNSGQSLSWIFHAVET
jgi:hypothetical protein